MALRRTPRGMVNTGTRIRPLIPKITKRLRRQQYGQGGGAVVAGYVWCIDNDGTNYGYVRGDYGSITPDTTRASGTEIDYVYVSDTDTMHVGFELGAYLPSISTFIIDLPNGMSFPIYWDMANHEYNGFETGLTVYAQSLQGTCINIEITHLDHTAVMWMAGFNDTMGEMQTQLIGQGTPDTDHSMPMLAPDHEGLYQTFDVDEPVWAYGRVVKNWFIYSEDFSHISWKVILGAAKEGVVTGIGPNGEDAMEVSFTANNSEIYQPVVGSITGLDCIVTFYMATTSGTQDMSIDIGQQRIVVTLTDTFQKITAYSVPLNVNVGIRGVLGGPVPENNIYIISAQTEIAAGRSDTTTPSEYIPTTTAPVQKVFNYANGNTVDGNGVVTEARGDYLIPQPYLVEQEEAESTWSYFNCTVANLLSVSGVTDTTPTTPWVGIVTNTLYFADNSVTRNGYRSYDRVDTITYVFSFFIKMDDGLVPDYVGGSTSGDFRVLIVGVNIFAASSNVEFVHLGDGLYLAYFELVATSSAITQNTGVVKYTGQSARGFQVGGFSLFENTTIEQAKSIQPIITEGAAVTTGPLKPQFDAANHDNNDGAYFTNVDNTGDDVVLMSDGLYDFLRIEDGGSVELNADQEFAGSCGTEWICTGTWVVGSGEASHPTAGTVDSLYIAGYSTVAGTVYAITYRISERSAGGVFASAGNVSSGTNELPGIYTSIITAGGTQGLRLIANATFVGKVDLIQAAVVDGKYVKLTDGTTQLQLPIPGPNQFFSVGAVYEGDVAGVNQMNLNVDGVWADGLGDDEVINGGFDTDTDWSKGVGWDITNSQAISDGSQVATSNLTQVGILTDGVEYSVRIDVDSLSSNITVYLNGASQLISSSGVTEYTMAATGPTLVILIAAGETCAVNSISVKEVIGNGSEGTPYDGSLGTGDIVLGETQHAVTRYQGGTYQEKKDKIDERMP